MASGEFKGLRAASSISTDSASPRSDDPSKPSPAGRRLRHLRTMTCVRSALRGTLGDFASNSPRLPPARHPRHRSLSGHHTSTPMPGYRDARSSRVVALPRRTGNDWADKKPSNANKGLCFPGADNRPGAATRSRAPGNSTASNDFRPTSNTSTRRPGRNPEIMVLDPASASPAFDGPRCRS